MFLTLECSFAACYAGNMAHSLIELRTERLWTQRQLARRARVAVRTVVWIEAGNACRMVTKRKLLRALGVEFSRWREVFGDERGDVPDVSVVRRVEERGAGRHGEGELPEESAGGAGALA